MEKVKLILLAIVVILGISFLLGTTVEGRQACTMKGCIRLDGGDFPERKCNTCQSVDPIFVFGAFDISSKCPVQEYTSVSGSVSSHRYETIWPECQIIIDTERPIFEKWQGN